MLNMHQMIKVKCGIIKKLNLQKFWGILFQYAQYQYLFSLHNNNNKTARTKKWNNGNQNAKHTNTVYTMCKIKKDMSIEISPVMFYY